MLRIRGSGNDMRRMILPIIKKYWKLLLSAMLVSALGCGIMVGMSGAYVSLDRSLDSYVRDDLYPHAFITTDVVNRSLAERLSGIGGVTRVDTRLCGDTYIKDGNGRYLSVRVFSYNEGDLQKFQTWSSADCGGAESIMLEYNFAVDNGISAGDTVAVRVGDEYRDYAVEAIVTAPETLSVQITDDSWGVNTDFGYAYASVDLLKKESEKERSAAKDELDDQEGELDDAEKDANEAFEETLKQLEEAKALLDEKKAEFADASKEAEKTRRELKDAKDKLRGTKKDLEKNIEDLQKAKPELKDAIKQLDEAIEKLNEAKAALKEIDKNLASLNDSLDKLNAKNVKDLIRVLRSAPQNTRLSDIYSAFDRFEDFLDVAESYGFVYNDNDTVAHIAEDIDMFIDIVESDYYYLGSSAVRALIARAQKGEDISTAPGYARLVETINRYDNTLQNGGDIVTAYNNAYANVAYLHTEIQNGHIREAVMLMMTFGSDVTLGQMRSSIRLMKTLSSTLAEATGKPIRTVGELVKAYDSTKAKLEKSISDLEKQRAEIVRELNRQGVKEKDIDKKIKELKKQRKQAQEQLDAIPDAIKKLKDGIKEVDKGVEEIDKALAEIDEQLAEAQEQLEEAEEEYEEGRKEYDTSLADAMSEFASLREELEKAYKDLSEEEGYESLCNQFMLYFEDGADQPELLRRAEAALGDDAVIKKSFVYEDSGVKNRIDINLAPIDTMSTFMPMVFFVVILIVVFLFMSLIIRQCRREIGILRALGFTSSSVRLLFCGVELVVSIAAILLGFAIGIGVMRYVGAYYRDFFPLHSFTYAINVKMSVLAAVLTIIVGQAATLIGTTIISRINPSEAMTRPAPSTAKIPRVLNAFTKNAKPMVKFSVSSLLRNKGRFVFSVICVAASVMMIFSSFAFITSKNHILHQLYDERSNYDCQIFFDEQPGEETVKQLSELDFVSNLQPLSYYEKEISFGGRSEKAVINALVPDTELIRVYDSEANRLELPQTGLIIERHLAERLGAKAGDTVTIEGEEFVISAVSDQSVSRFQYMSAESAAPLGEGSLGCLILDIDEADEQKLLARLTETDGYLYCVFTRLSYEGNAKVFRTYDLATSVIIGFAVLIGLTIVYNTTQTNLLEKKKELCVLRTLGFQRSEISRSWFVQSLLQFICSCAVGLPVGVIVAKTALSKISTEGREYVFANGPKEYAVTALIVFAYIVLSHVLAMRSLKHWDIVETVKEKE